MTLLTDGPVTVTDLVSAVRHQQRPTPATTVDAPGAAAGVPDVGVVAAHPGAGASSVAVALMDALMARGEAEVTLIDAAPAAVSGLLSAFECDIDAGDSAWRAGRRGSGRILRSSTYDGPAKEAARALAPNGLVVVDGARLQLPCAARVVVCRPTVPGIGRVEDALTRCEAAAVAVVGARKWPREVAAAIGPVLAKLDREGSVVFIPAHADLAIRGVTTDPTPAPVLRAAAPLAELILRRPRTKGLRR